MKKENQLPFFFRLLGGEMLALEVVEMGEDEGVCKALQEAELEERHARIEMLRCQTCCYREGAKLFSDLQQLAGVLCSAADALDDIVKVRSLVEKTTWIDRDEQGNWKLPDAVEKMLREKLGVELAAAIAKGKQQERSSGFNRSFRPPTAVPSKRESEGERKKGGDSVIRTQHGGNGGNGGTSMTRSCEPITCSSQDATGSHH